MADCARDDPRLRRPVVRYPGGKTDVFRVLRDPAMASDLRRRIELTPFARRDFEAISYDALDKEPSVVERARLTIYRSFAGFGSAAVYSAHSTGFRSSCARSGTIPAHDWAGYPDHIPAFVDRMNPQCAQRLSATDDEVSCI